jgi:G3E family GTPase
MTPLLLVAGLLGAGKTTFLRALLPALGRRGLRARVLLNDFQNTRVDGATLADVAPDLVALAGACVCCESLDQLLEALAAIPGGPGEVVVVETNGATDTAELLTVVSGAQGLDRLSPPLQLTVVDGKRYGRRDWQNVMEQEQIATASHVAVSRLDVVSPERAGEVNRALALCAPRAWRVTPETMADALAALRDAPHPARPGPPHSHGDHGDHAAHLHFASLELPLPAPVDAAALLRFLGELPAEVLRVKGVALLRDPPGDKRSFHKVEDEAEISPCQLADPETIAPAAVFVGPRLPVDLIRRRVAALLAPITDS